MILCVCSCEHLPRQAPTRPLRQLEAAFTAPLTPRHRAFDLRLDPVSETAGFECLRISATTYSETTQRFKTVKGEYYRTKRRLVGEAVPLVLVAPILAGAASDYVPSRLFCRYAASVGMSAFFVYQEDSILSAQLDALGHDALLRETLVDNRKILHLMATLPDVDRRRIGSLGISLGAIRNVPLIAVEPLLVANVLCIGGVDLPDILQDSNEYGVTHYLKRRWRAHGVTASEVRDEFAHHLVLEPGHYAAAISNERVLLVLARHDDKVPIANGLLLKEKLQHPECEILPTGHYTSLLMAAYMSRKAFNFLRRRFREVTSAPPSD